MQLEQNQYMFFQKSMNPVKLIERTKDNWAVERTHGASKGKRMVVPASGLLPFNKAICDQQSNSDHKEVTKCVLSEVLKYDWPVEIIANPQSKTCLVSVAWSGFVLYKADSICDAQAHCERNRLAVQLIVN